MKHLLLTLTLLLSSKAAFAMHAYATDNCVAMTQESEKISYELSNGEPSSPHRLVPADDKPGSDSLWVNLDQSSNSTDMPAKDSILVLKTTGIEKGPSKKIDDGCFQGSSWTYVRNATVTGLSDTGRNLLKLSIGETIRFSCYADYEAPTGTHCQ